MKSKKAEFYCCEDETKKCRDGMRDISGKFVWKFIGNMTEKEAQKRGLFVSGSIRGKELYHAYAKGDLK